MQPPGVIGASLAHGNAAMQDFVGDDAVQFKGKPKDGVDPRTVAADGVSGSGGAIPHAQAIQQSFGAFDVGSIEAHTGTEAAQANAELGTEAYATGNAVAFSHAPDLHTAAHEAAHIVQQSQGVALSGGVGRSGDAYEQQADAVADTVVAGGSAESLLGGAAGGASGGASAGDSVQALHGDLNTPVNANIAGQNPEMEGKTVGQAAEGLSERDANFNPKRKVEFEAELAKRILTTPGPVLPIVREISTKMLQYFDAKVDAGLASANQDLAALGKHFAGLADRNDPTVEHANEIFFGRLADTTAELKDGVAPAMRALLQGGGSIPQQVFAHHQFIDQIWDARGAGDFANNIPAQLGALGGQQGTALNFQMEAVAPKDMRKKDGEEVEEFKNRGRFKPGEEGSRVHETFGQGDKAVPTTGAAKGIVARPSTNGSNAQSAAKDVGSLNLNAGDGGEQAHQRGIDRLTMDESNAFIQNARLVLDMPLAGSISGTTADLMEVSKIFGCSKPHLYAIGVLGHLASAGAHSFHEIATAASLAGINYTPGDYASFIPAEYMSIVADLFDKYSDVISPQA